MVYVLLERVRSLAKGTSLRHHGDEGRCIYRVTVAADREGVSPIT